jgi:hypothetical protein
MPFAPKIILFHNEFVICITDHWILKVSLYIKTRLKSVFLTLNFYVTTKMFIL